MRGQNLMPKPYYAFFVSTMRGCEDLLTAEVQQLGAQQVQPEKGGVYCYGDLGLGYRLCLWCRVAQRVLLPLVGMRLRTAQDIYTALRGFPWHEHLGPDHTLAVQVVCSRQSLVRHTNYAGQLVKDAVVDSLRASQGRRPDVQRHQPDVPLHLFVQKNRAILSLDFAGEPLQKRGYRQAGGQAPLKETLAAAILYRLDWPRLARGGRPLAIPMCGSGTLLWEGAMMAAAYPPGWLRQYFGFQGWRGHDASLWQQLWDQAQPCAQQAWQQLPPLTGWDNSRKALRDARENARALGLTSHVKLFQSSLEATPPDVAGDQPGLLVLNPPYGQRLSSSIPLAAAYHGYAQALSRQFAGWQAGILLPEEELLGVLGMTEKQHWRLDNGPLRICLAQLAVPQEQLALPAGSQMLLQRLRKNRKRLERWARKQGLTAYRLYHRDLPEYNFIIDRYGDYLHVQELQAPASVPEEKARRRRHEALAALPTACDVPPEALVVKQRQQRDPARQQYQRQAQTEQFFTVTEGGYQFYVNLWDYMDTGLFIHHRKPRAYVASLAAGRDFLNLFAYTGAVSVYAAGSGARSTTSIDLSATYLRWAQHNFQLNGLDSQRHRFLRRDCLQWLKQAQAGYDIIFIDPPSFSHSSSMTASWDVQRDHAGLLAAAYRLLRPGGMLLFAVHRRGFQLQPGLPGECEIKELSEKTRPEEFPQHRLPHRLWQMHKPVPEADADMT